MKMANTKITKKDYFRTIKGIVEAAALEPTNKQNILAFIDREVELLAKKSGTSKETKTQKANTAIKATVLEVLADMGKPVTISELMEDARLSTYEEEGKDDIKTIKMTNQKLSSLLKQMKDDGAVVRTENKKKAYFSLPVVVQVELEEEEPTADAE